MSRRAKSQPLADPLIEAPGASEEWSRRYGQAVMNTFGPPQAVFVRGQGVKLWDADGKEYLDLLAGIAVNTLGQAHPKVLEAVESQLATLGHVSNFFATPPQVQLAERLAAMATRNQPDTGAKVFFANSGAEANETAFKLTRLTGRTKVVAMEGSFHGRTMGALALTHKAQYREPFEPLPGVVEFVPYGDCDALRKAVDDATAAVVIEPIQGENGVVVPPAGFLADARQATREVGALLWLDEVQSGMGRTGTWLASEPSGVTGDIVTLAKALGNGFPIGACVATGPAADLFGPGMHGNTFGGNPVAAAAGLAVIDTIESEGLMARSDELGRHLAERLEDLMLYEIAGCRGAGLLRGIVLNRDIAPELAKAALEEGFVVNAPRANVLRLTPPLIVTAGQLDGFIDALPGLLRRFA
ncbi:MAG: acetylornithine transaminase [Propionibacteriaceae bacterium]|jgi:acetylornithine aminotransferase|nr:acetylornithine transaminase [Propionibacteriaceae bacterium]